MRLTGVRRRIGQIGGVGNVGRMDNAPLISGIDVDELSEQIRPQDDLFRHVNEHWFGLHAIPEDKSRYGSFIILDEQSEEAIHEIVEEARTAPPGSEARKFGDLYASFMDEDRIEERGAEPLGGDRKSV